MRSGIFKVHGSHASCANRPTCPTSPTCPTFFAPTLCIAQCALPANSPRSYVLLNFRSAQPPHSPVPIVRTSPYKSIQVRISLPAPCALHNVLCQPSGGSRARQGDSRPLRSGTFAAASRWECALFSGESHAHGARGETLLFPPCPPLSPMCCIEACGTLCGFFTVRGARTVSRPGGKRCGLVLGATRQPPIFWGLSLHHCAAIPSLGPCALGTEGPRPVC